jgi:hypothetical protein
MEISSFTSAVFLVFHTHILSMFSLTLALINIYKYHISSDMEIIFTGSRRPIYLVRTLNWIVFGVALFLFPFLPVVAARINLRIALALMILSELLFNSSYFSAMLRETIEFAIDLPNKVNEAWKWTRNL